MSVASRAVTVCCLRDMWSFPPGRLSVMATLRRKTGARQTGFLRLAERARQLAAGADAELGVGGAEVQLDGLARDPQRLRDLAVAEPGDGEVGDPALARGQRVRPAQRLAARAP